jgi:hypothetical protein
MTIPHDPGPRAGEPAIAPDPGAAPPAAGRRGRSRSRGESTLVRVVATCGGVGIATAVAAILGWQDVSAWPIGLVSSLLTLVIVALLWARTPARRSRV